MVKWFARLFAVLALAGAGAGIYVAITSVKTKHEVTESQARDAMSQLGDVNRDLATKLKALRAGSSPHAAQESGRAAAALAHKLDSDVSTEGDLGITVHAVLKAELTYLDAIGSTLNNPRSPLRSRINEFAIALRQALQNVPGGEPGLIAGGANLVVYSKRRTGGV